MPDFLLYLFAKDLCQLGIRDPTVCVTDKVSQENKFSDKGKDNSSVHTWGELCRGHYMAKPGRS